MIRVEGLRKRYASTEALRGIDLDVPAGTVCGLLGPNGAGKTTAVRILATLLRPDAGRAEVAGLDVVRDAAALRFRIGLAGQHAAVDELLTGQRNLELFGRLYHLPRAAARARAEELLERFGLARAARRPVKEYSGGMRRRLDLAASLIVAPRVLFMDEPTTGLDPRSRMELWERLRALVNEGTTLLLTTQYLDEADHLTDQVVVLKEGRVAASGSPAALKRQVGGDRVRILVREPADVPAALRALHEAGSHPAAGSATEADRLVTVPAPEGAQSLIRVAGALATAGIPVEDLALRRPTLDEVFLRLTA
ncbi:putative ABC transporter ATP-binding protein [[Actinomadura] parvosata subsp. kistnae]|uniref:Daunorubicin/doxorubicin resistance ABC transporter ATP-binding protein DrrA n=1 Tax=[Actinomadura] parvosata subsp. kistnae TaxID=1909395 RepID=A0A1U9ZQP5_9ACTN|nr:ATP-binding cassette domain-containing protein [Nonomuraea sp. ATCC 55076]AQZ60265.1 daunorubicin/doxorubicin resistance ABC transporter ATP-binding protein DrrA [Nonomuraea sp. ATCC 55076]SPL91245.1 putative ABC transporter ATP-binding protein [Actinomadura parvosata subsp. kistnae]